MFATGGSPEELKMAIKKPYFLIITGAVILLFHSYTTYQRVKLEVIGKIVTREEHNYKNNPNLTFTVYKLENLSTGKEFTYKANSTDPALSRNLQVSSNVEKQRGNIDYLVDKNTIKAFPKKIYFSGIFLGSLLFIIGIVKQIKLTRKWLSKP